MSVQIRNMCREQLLLFPPSLNDWVPKNHLARFIIQSVETLPLKLSDFRLNERGTGDKMYEPKAMLELLIYSYATGTFSSRRIEQATFDDVPTRFIMANEHPDHATIHAFRQRNQVVIQKAFTQVLLYARELKMLKMGLVSIDGTLLRANALKKRNTTKSTLEKQIDEYRTKVKSLLQEAEAANARGDESVTKLPDELPRSEELKKALKKTQTILKNRNDPKSDGPGFANDEGRAAL